MFDTNRTLICARTSASHSAFVEPARPDIKAMLGIPATKVFEVYIDGLADLREQDRLTSSDPVESYVVLGAEAFDIDLVRHTHLTVEGTWGS